MRKHIFKISSETFWWKENFKRLHNWFSSSFRSPFAVSLAILLNEYWTFSENVILINIFLHVLWGILVCGKYQVQYVVTTRTWYLSPVCCTSILIIYLNTTCKSNLFYKWLYSFVVSGMYLVTLECNWNFL